MTMNPSRRLTRREYLDIAGMGGGEVRHIMQNLLGITHISAYNLQDRLDYESELFQDI
jgi:hypothetical protein